MTLKVPQDQDKETAGAETEPKTLSDFANKFALTARFAPRLIPDISTPHVTISEFSHRFRFPTIRALTGELVPIVTIALDTWTV